MLEIFANSPVAHVTTDNITSNPNQTILTAKSIADAVAEISSWPGYHPTPIHNLDHLAGKLGLNSISYKNEGGRFGVGSFKALGAPYAGLRVLQRELSKSLAKNLELSEVHNAQYTELKKKITLVAATDGNHGRSLAWGAKTFGVHCKIYIHNHVSENRASAIAEFGAEVIRVDRDYDYSVKICKDEAEKNGWFVVSDTSWEGYSEAPTDVMAGYGLMIREIHQQLEQPPTHLFVQGGVGGLAAATVAGLYQIYKDHSPKVIIVEPDLAPCLFESAKNGQATNVKIIKETQMAGLSCGKPSLLAWQIIEESVHDYLTIPEALVAPAMRLLANPGGSDTGIVAGESAIAGLAGLIAGCLQPDLKTKLQLDENSRILLIGSEGATDQKIYNDIINGKF
jgi:diaminopropionate ammonia-lyase